VQDDPTNFLEISVIAEMLQIIEQIETNCKGKVGEDIVNERIKQVAYAKILCNIYHKDIKYLIKAYSALGIAYFDISYFEQAQEHLLNAFKLNENLTDEDNLNMKEQQIKILINLAKCYLENDKVNPALQISERSLKMNKAIFGDDHISNGDIYYVISKANTKLGNYKTAIENLKEMYEIYEKAEGSNSEKTAKILMEIGQVYELWEMYNDAIDNYEKSYKIWEQIISNDDYEVLFHLSIKLADLYQKNNNADKAYSLLCQTDEKYGERTNRSTKQKFIYQKNRIKYSMFLKDAKDLYLEEYLRLESILTEADENPNALAKTCISIAVIFLDRRDKEKCLEYYHKAERIFENNGNETRLAEVKAKIEDIESQQFDDVNNEEEDERNDNDGYDDEDND
jgi:tetratricopeptide (TPR) repeat protein